jgi:hypothetical protein
MRGREDIATIADRNDKATPALADLHDGRCGGADDLGLAHRRHPAFAL